MNIRLKRTPGIYLVGFMGSGKSTVGAILAERLGWSFIDLDAEIERAEGTTISEIFAARGESAFRALETEAIRRLVAQVECGCPAVVALGGGAFVSARNRELLEEHGVTVWLDCPLEIAKSRVASSSHRPLAQDPSAFARLYESRRESYALSDVHVTTECGHPAVIVDAILANPIFR